MPMPAKPLSAMGVSITRCSPNLLEHPLADLVGALVVADLFAHEEDALVALHLLDHRLAEGLAVSNAAHASSFWLVESGARTGRRRWSPRASSGPGSGLSSAKLTASAISRLDLGLERLRARVAEPVRRRARSRARSSGSLLLALFELLRRAVLAGIAHRVAAEAVGADLDERRLRCSRARCDRLADALSTSSTSSTKKRSRADAVAERLHRRRPRRSSCARAACPSSTRCSRR